MVARYPTHKLFTSQTGPRPREVVVKLPARPVPVEQAGDADDDTPIMAGNVQVLCSLPPSRLGGEHQLNFHGRVTKPSVKNFQIVNSADRQQVSRVRSYGSILPHACIVGPTRVDAVWPA